MNKYFSKESIAWIVTSLAVAIGILVTGSANCLWAFLIPAICFH